MPKATDETKASAVDPPKEEPDSSIAIGEPSPAPADPKDVLELANQLYAEDSRCDGKKLPPAMEAVCLAIYAALASQL